MSDSARSRGRGAMGVGLRGTTVHLADDPEQDAAVELTVVPAELVPDDRLVEAFAVHTALLRRLSGAPGVAGMHGCTRRPDGSVVLASRRPAGATLREVMMREGCMAPERAVGLAIQMSQVLERVHSVGLAHGGLRPDNVVLTGRGETIALTRVGIEWLIAQHAAGAATGSPSPYWAPEQQRGIATEQSDVYAVGAILYEMLAGVPPPGAEPPDGPRVARALGARCPRIAPSLERPIVRALQPLPENRQADATVMCNDLWQAPRLGGEPDGPRTPRSSKPARPEGSPLRPRRSTALVGALAGLIAAALVASWLVSAWIPMGAHPPEPVTATVGAAPVALPLAASTGEATDARVDDRAPAAAPGRAASAPSPPAAAARVPHPSDRRAPPVSAPRHRPVIAPSAPSPAPASRADDVPPSAPSAGAPTPPGPSEALSHVDRQSKDWRGSRVRQRDAADDSTAIIDWLLSEGQRRHP